MNYSGQSLNCELRIDCCIQALPLKISKDGWDERGHQNRLLAKALPEWDFIYFSKDRALDRSLKVTSVNHKRFFAKARPD